MKTISIGKQNFASLREQQCFYVDKTEFIREWWEGKDEVTLITRPRRFGKTLNMSMMERFWNIKYKGQGEIFQDLSIWREEKYRNLQGTYPVIFLSFSEAKGNNYAEVIEQISQTIIELCLENQFLRSSDRLTDEDKQYFDSIKMDISRGGDITRAIKKMSYCLYRHYDKKVIILLDEYDTPMQEAYVKGYWNELTDFIKKLFHSTFKANTYLEKAIMTGITRISKESFFSGLNNLNVVTTASNEYSTCFGFTEEEVFNAMDEFNLTNKEEVKSWYDGFTFGEVKDIYNPWSITNMLKKGQLKTYWANTSSNALVGKLLREGNKNIKMQFEQLVLGESIKCKIDEEIVYNQLDDDENAIWSLLLASGYLKVLYINEEEYELALTNYEVTKMFKNLISDWFNKKDLEYNDFVKALLTGNLEEMNFYMNRITLSVFSFFDTGNRPSEEAEPERFYHGFVLGLLVDLEGSYVVTSNRESGKGRYDVLLEPTNKEDVGIILEFKVYNSKQEESLEETAQAALKQIEERKYEQTLLDRGIEQGRIRKYGFAFRGKEVLIAEGN